MNDNNRRTDNEFDMDELFTEAENIYQAKKAVQAETELKQDAAANSAKEAVNAAPKTSQAPQPKFARTPAPENSATPQPKYARTPAYTANTVAQAQVNMPKDAEPERKKLSAAVIISRTAIALFMVFVIATVAVFGLNYFNMRKHRLEAQKLSLTVEKPKAEETDLVGEDGILEKYREAYNKNHDLVGWITVPNTKIDHPVVQASDNAYYMRKNFEKGYERRGSIFMDCRCNSKNYVKNTILYGHNFLDSTMFADLEKYKDLDFYKSAPVIEFNSIYKNQKWKVFGVYLINVEEKDDNGYVFYSIHPFMTDDNFEAYVQAVRERSIINAPVDVERTDKMLTLSTCTRDMDLKGHGQTNARCIIVARLVRDGEKEDVNVAAATYNENPRYPQVWYTAHNLKNPYVNSPNFWYPEGNE